MSPEPLPEPGPELAWRNRRILAERIGWPAGVLEECERLDAANPDWWIAWLGENICPGFDRPAYYWAVRDGDGGRRQDIYAPGPEALAEAIEQAPPPGLWQMRQVIPQRHGN